MVALVIVLTMVVALLTVLVAGLLRSHADILKALHDLGVGVGDPTSPAGAHAPAGPVPLTLGPPLPAERDGVSAPTVAGVTPDGDGIAVAPTSGDGLTLLAFLSSGCATCAAFWQAFRAPGQLDLPVGTRLVVVTKGPELELPAEVRAHAAPGLEVVLSTEAWADYEVPGSPFFVLVDGRAGRRVGEGVANHFDQVAELVRRAQADREGFHLQGDEGTPAASRSRGWDAGLDGPGRERANDRELRAAGIEPGDPSLYPSSPADLFAPVDQPSPAPVEPSAPVGRLR